MTTLTHPHLSQLDIDVMSGMRPCLVVRTTLEYWERTALRAARYHFQQRHLPMARSASRTWVAVLRDCRAVRSSRSW